MSFDIPRLRRAVAPFRLHWFPRLRSTNDHAAVLRRRGDLFAPSIVLAGTQTAGRGRGDHVWWSGPGCLTVTFVLAPNDHVAPHGLPLLAGLAVRAAAAELTGKPGLVLKWPNDLLHDDGRSLRKVAGLLCERIDGADLIGLGLNVNVDPCFAPPELSGRLASLSQLVGRPLDLTEALATVARHLRRVMAEQQRHPFATALREYHAHHALLGRWIEVIGAGETGTVTGLCEGMDEMGRLLVREKGKLHRVISGQVVVRPPESQGLDDSD